MATFNDRMETTSPEMVAAAAGTINRAIRTRVSALRVVRYDFSKSQIFKNFSLMDKMDDAIAALESSKYRLNEKQSGCETILLHSCQIFAAFFFCSNPTSISF